jgi:hypothetical protein
MDLLTMGVNKNISILMLFDCVLVNTGLGFHWIFTSGKQGVYMCIDDAINGFSKNISTLYF